MNKYKVGLLAETKTPPDRRAALTPNTAVELLNKFHNIELFIQPSTLRAFKDSEYEAKGLVMNENLSDCDILLGIKEVKIPKLIDNKKYLYFAHVAKKQDHNKPLLKAMLDKKISMIDYEYLTDEKGIRLVAFGKWAGVVGGYNAIRTWGLKTKEFEIKPAHEYHDKAEMYLNIQNLKISPLKIVLTGGGRVANGAVETLKAFNIQEVSPFDFISKQFAHPVYTKLEPWDYVKHNEGKEFKLEHFFQYPQEYVSIFEPYTKVADLYIACHFWDPKSPKFINRDDAKKDDFNIKVVADISCDINGPIDSTLRASTIDNPFYDYNPFTGNEEPAFSSQKNITVMAIDNLPAELPRDASEDFSKALIDNVFPFLFGEDSKNVIQRATICKDGSLTEKFSYLTDWVNS